MSRPHDKHGIPVYPGDVIRTYHYANYRHRRKMYLYHVAVEDHGHLYGVPAMDLALPHAGGKFMLTDDSLKESEIVQGHGPERLMEFIKRPRKDGGKGNDPT